MLLRATDHGPGANLSAASIPEPPDWTWSGPTADQHNPHALPPPLAGAFGPWAAHALRALVGPGGGRFKPDTRDPPLLTHAHSLAPWLVHHAVEERQAQAGERAGGRPVASVEELVLFLCWKHPACSHRLLQEAMLVMWHKPDPPFCSALGVIRRMLLMVDGLEVIN